MPRLCQFLAQVSVVIELAIENYDRVAVIGGHRLVATFEIDDAQPDGSQRHFRGFPDALLVWPAMNQRSRDFPDPLRIRDLLKMSKPSYPAHFFGIPAFLPPRRKLHCR